MSLYGGIDLHANNSVVVLLNAQDQVVYQKRLPNNLPTILEPLAPHHAEIEGLVVESTYNWYWLVDGLMEAGYRVHLANPAAIQQYNGLKYSDDHSDARWLAHLLRLGVLPTGYIYPKAERAVRDLLRKRAHLVRQHTSNVLSVHNIMVRNTGMRLSVKRIRELRGSRSRRAKNAKVVPRVVKQRHFESYFAEIRRAKSSVSFADRQRRKCSFFSSVLHCMYSQSVVGLWHVLFRYSGNPVDEAGARELAARGAPGAGRHQQPRGA